MSPALARPAIVSVASPTACASDSSAFERVRALRTRLRAAVRLERYGEAAEVRDELARELAKLPDEDAVREANERFYVAYAAADVDALRDVWLDAKTVSCAHPLADLAVGLPDVLASWSAVFAMGKPVSVDCDIISLQVRMNMAWVVAHQTVRSVRGDAVIGGLRIATNVFQKRGGTWKLVHHHASPVVIEDDQSNSK